MFVFRVMLDANSGLGHLTRCLLLADKLQSHGGCCFIVDEIPEAVRPFIEGRQVYALSAGLDQQTDALQTLACLQQNVNEKVDWLIVDHYRLDLVWETMMGEQGYRLMAIDDLLRNHQVDALLDYKWRGDSAPQSYGDLTSAQADLLLGPQYVLLSSIKARNAMPHSPFRIALGLGGGGEAGMLNQLVARVVKAFEQLQTPLQLKVIVGPLLQAVEDLNTSVKTADFIQIEWIHGKTDLSAELAWCDFYLGAAGATLYALRALQKPALLFGLSVSQQNEQSQLDDIGQYFFIEQWGDVDYEKLAWFLPVLWEHYDRIKALFASAKISIDDQGADRVARYLVERKLSSLSLRPSNNQAWQSLIKDYAIRPVVDSDINHYLQSRNHAANRQNMLSHDSIDPLSHYAWWFENIRYSFLLTQAQQPKLYIWDQLLRYQDESFLIGGWFVCDERACHQDAMVALDWQIKRCDKLYPNVKWMAVISRQNRYVKLLNSYFGFQEIPSDSRYIKVVEAFFPNAGLDEFVYVYR